MNGKVSNKVLLKWFIKEEYRVFETLFGGKRLLMFPVTLFVLSILLGASIPAFGLSAELSAAVMMVLVGLFGLQTGSIGFEARDTLDNLMGDSERILFSSRTLPISQKRLAGLFLLKDAIVYSTFMILPIYIGVIVGLAASPFATSVTAIGLSGFGLSYLLVILSFLFGVSAGFVMTTVTYKSLKGLASMFVMLAVIAPIAYMGYSSPSVFIDSGSLTIGLLMIIGTVTFTLIGLWQFNITNSKNKKSSHSNILGYLSNNITVSARAQIMIKTMLDVVRSPGGLWKIIFSTGVISMTIVFLVQIVKQVMVTGISPSFLYASLFSLAVFPVYTLVYRYDSNTYYSSYPITERDVKFAKSATYVVLSLLVVGSYYTVATVTYGIDVFSYVTGLFVLVSLIVYQLGVFLLVAKDEPLKFLFNGMMFSGYSASLLLVMIPLTMVGLYGAAIPAVITRIALAVCGFCFVAGGLLSGFAVRSEG